MLWLLLTRLCLQKILYILLFQHKQENGFISSIYKKAETPSRASAAEWSPGSDDGRPEREFMENLRIENNKIYTTTAIGKTDVFEIVTKIPKGFFVWNIGENMGTHEYIPLCQLLHPEDSKCFSINPKTLKAIKVSPEEWEKLEKAGNWGIGNLKQAEKALKSKRRGYVSDKKRAAANITIDIFRKICE